MVSILPEIDTPVQSPRKLVSIEAGSRFGVFLL